MIDKIDNLANEIDSNSLLPNNELANKILTQIDKIRSIAKPNLQLNNNIELFNTLQIYNFAIESRAHAFYRLIGFPVVSKEGNFYNPGFGFTEKNQVQIQENISSEFLNFSFLRENFVERENNIFKNQDLNSTTYALICRFLKPFNNLNSENQSYFVEDRNKYIKQLNLSFNIKKNHYLKPFVTDHRIDLTVNPEFNKIAVPFLPNKFATQIANNKYLLRPGIETILRLRLQNKTNSKIENISNIQQNFSSINQEEILKNINKYSNLEINIIQKTFKNIDLLISNLLESIKNLDFIEQKINFKPIIDIRGPEFGGKMGADSNSILENKIKELNIKKILSEMTQTLPLDLGDFALDLILQLDNIDFYNQKIFNLEQEKKQLYDIGFSSLKSISQITGEFSGLGLIDIIAIYTALFSIDLDVLLSFLDQSSFQRLYQNNSNLRNSEVEIRQQNGPKYNIFEAMNILENHVSIYLNHADFLLKK